MARVLIVDDDVAALAVARQAVRAAGHEPVAVTSAADARAALASASAPEVLLVAPRADGGEALALAAATNGRGGLPLVLVLGSTPTGSTPTAAADDAATPLPTVPAPLVAATLAARIAAGLAERTVASHPRGRTVAAPSAPPATGDSARESPRAAQRGAGVEATLRALFRRPARPPSVPPPPPPAPPPQPLAPATAPGGASLRIPAAAPPAIPAAASTPGRSRSVAEWEEVARTGDYFAVLGLDRDATGPHVRSAASRLLNELDTARLAADAPSVATLDEIRQVIVDARDVLGDDSRRGYYLRAIDRRGRG